MTATIHPLHPEHAGHAGPDTPAGRMLRALEAMASNLIGEQLKTMFDSADDLLFEMSSKAKDGREQRLFLDTMRTVRLEQARIQKTFQDSLHRAFNRSNLESFGNSAKLDDLESWTMQEPSDLEEKIAISNMDSKAHSLFASQLYELEQRMSQVSAQSGGAVSGAELTPARIVEAFQRSMKGLDIEFPIKLVIYRLFDRMVVSNLGSVFAGANNLLAEHGFQPRQAARKEVPKPPPPAGFGGSAGEAPAPSTLPPVFHGMSRGLHSEYLTQALQPYLQPGAVPAPAAPSGAAAAPGPAFANGPQGGPISFDGSQDNAQLAAEMLAVMQAIGRGQPIDSWMPAQNLALVSRMFSDLYSDPRLPEAARPTLGKLQFPVMKVAVGDPDFFANPRHPVRTLVNDVFETASEVRDNQSADFQRLEQLVRDLLQRFDMNPARLHQVARGARPVSEEEAELFLEQQRKRSEAQRGNLKEKTRRIVAQELRLHIGNRILPKPLMAVLLSGFAPLLATYYLRGGGESQDWKQSLELLDQLLRSFDPGALLEPDRAQKEAQIVASVSQRLHSAGLSEEKVHGLITGLVGSYLLLSLSPQGFSSAAAVKPAATPVTQTPEVKPPSAAVTPSAPPPPAPAAPTTSDSQGGLSLLLKAGAWFKVWQASAQHCRWLKLTSFHPEHDLVVFVDFGEENFLKMRLSAFVQDLVAERSAPVSPDPATPKLIQLLPAQPSEPIEPAASWHKNNPLPDTRRA